MKREKNCQMRGLEENKKPWSENGSQERNQLTEKRKRPDKDRKKVPKKKEKGQVDSDDVQEKQERKEGQKRGLRRPKK